MSSGRRQVFFTIPTLTGGGAERVMVTLLQHLDRSKLKLALAVVDMREAAYLDDVPSDVELIDLRCTRVRYALPKIVRLIWQRRPDVVFSMLSHLNLALAVLRPLLPDGVRYIARETVVVSEDLCRYAYPNWWRWAYRRFYRRFDVVVCQSQDIHDDLVNHFALPASKAVVIHNPVDVQRVRRLSAEPLPAGFEVDVPQGSSERPLHLVAAGRLDWQKGFDLLIEALALCANLNVRLTILGEGPLRAELKRLARERNVTSRIRFAGFQKNPYPFFARADAFVLSSRYEGCPNVVLEALACGTPVIATPAPGGVREILDGVKNCVLATSVTSQALAEAIRCFQPGQRVPDEVIKPFAVETITRRYEQELTRHLSS